MSGPQPPAGFALPDPARPLDVDEICATLPSDIVLRGMFLQGVVDMCAKRGQPLVGFGPYIAFKEYPVATHVRLLAAAGRALYPQDSARRAFQLLGRDAYSTLVDTMIGKVIFGVLGRDIVRITRLVGKAYEVAGRGVTATLLEMSDRHSHVAIDGAFALADNYHVGAFEGVVDVCRRTCTIWTKPTPRGAELFTVWSDPV
jgi:uncharacterized protein (TIGR02265 family)